jgi:DNA repair protein RadD
MTLLKPRWYQYEASDAVFTSLRNNPDAAPIVALPTGTGKSLVISMLCEEAIRQYPGMRILVLTHVRELIEQNYKKLKEMWPQAPVSVYSAGLKSKDIHGAIVFAGVQSIANILDKMGKFNWVIIDECHLISPKQTTRYQQVIAAVRKVLPSARVTGLTATPYRVGQGMLTDGGLFNEVCFNLCTIDGFAQLLAEGYLAPLIPRKTYTAYNVTKVGTVAGEFNEGELQKAVDQDDLTEKVIHETIHLAQNRKHWLVFCAGVQHAEHVAAELTRQGVSCAVVHGELSLDERDRRINAFKSGQIQAIVNNNVLTTGFDFPAIDCIVMLRPTMSPGLWVQMLGRGTRPSVATGKQNCLVLDFALNTERLGPINDPVLPRKPGKGRPKSGGGSMMLARVCTVCFAYSHPRAAVCQACSAPFPVNVDLASQASTAELMAAPTSAPTIARYTCNFQVLHKHVGMNSGMPCVRVDYACGKARFQEYLHVERAGRWRNDALDWLRKRLPPGYDVESLKTADDVVRIANKLAQPKSVSVISAGRFPRVMDVTL